MLSRVEVEEIMGLADDVEDLAYAFGAGFGREDQVWQAKKDFHEYISRLEMSSLANERMEPDLTGRGVDNNVVRVGGVWVLTGEQWLKLQSMIDDYGSACISLGQGVEVGEYVLMREMELENYLLSLLAPSLASEQMEPQLTGRESL